MQITNTIGQEQDTRHAKLLAEILSLLVRYSDPFGNQWVETRGDTEIRLHSRYTTGGRAYQITQTVNVSFLQATVINETPTP
jgi:hypothetical protein